MVSGVEQPGELATDELHDRYNRMLLGKALLAFEGYAQVSGGDAGFRVSGARWWESRLEATHRCKRGIAVYCVGVLRCIAVYCVASMGQCMGPRG